MQLKKHKLFYKYLIPYILIMMIPTLVLTIFINRSLLSRLRNQYVQDSKESLNQFMYATDKNMSQLQVIRDHILSQSDLMPLPNIEDVATSRAIIKELKKYSISNSFVLDIAFYIEGDSYIYTSGSTYDIDKFFTGQQFYQNWSTDEFLDILSQSFSQYVRPEETVYRNGISYDAMSILYPMQFKNKKAYLIFLVDTSTLNIEEASSAFFITDKNGALLYSTVSQVISKDIYEDYNIDEILDGDIKFINNDEYLLSYKHSDYTNWDYYKITTIQKVYGDFFKLKQGFYGIILLIIFVGSIIIYFSMNVNYNPLKRLKKLTDDLDIGDDNDQDTIKCIKHTLTNLAHENTELKGKKFQIDRNNFINSLLKGKITSKDEFAEQISYYDLCKLQNSYYFVLILMFKSRDEDKDSHLKIDSNKLEDLINTLLPGYIREQSENSKYIFIGSLEKKARLPFSHDILDTHDLLQKELNMDVALATSTIYKGFNKIPKCYMEASLAIDYCFIKGTNCVIDSSQLVLNEDIGAVYPQQMFDKLNYQIKNGDVDKIQEVLDEIIDYIKTSDLPLYYAKGMCYQLINNISSMIEHLNNELLTNRSKLSYATVLADFDTAEELMEAVRNISINICSFIRDEKSESESNLITEIKEYIKENAMDSNFSVQNTADHFDMTLPAISSFFKYHSGITIMDYVTELRMEYTRELLLEEKFTLNEIVEAVGYINTSSFIRKFKSIHGLTPGQYVKHYKEKGV